MSEEAEQDFQPGVVSGDRVLLVMEDGSYEAGVLLGLSNIGVHLLSQYVEVKTQVRVTEKDREELVDVLEGLTRKETRALAREMELVGKRGSWTTNWLDLKQMILNKTVEQIESTTVAPTMTLRPVGIPMIVALRKIDKIAHLDKWDEDVTLRQTELDLGDLEAVAAGAEEEVEGAAEAS